MKYLLRKVMLYIFIAWAALTMNFLIPRLMPGDPVSLLVEKLQGRIDPAAMDAIAASYGITDAPLIVQYWQYLVDLAHGDLGLSIGFFPCRSPTSSGPRFRGRSASSASPRSSASSSAQVWASCSPGDAVRGATTLPALTFLNAVPYFWMALILVLILSVNLGWFPVSHAYEPGLMPGWNWEFISSVLYHGILPAVTIVLASFAGWVLGMRNMTVTVLGEDYVTMAEAKGLPKHMVMLNYAARNAILPSITGFALSLGAVVGGSMLTEVIFNYPGVGYTLFEAVGNQDFPLMQGLFLIISLAVIVANLFADIVYVFLDPRTRQEG